MKLLKQFVVAALLSVTFGYAFAELTLVKREVVLFEKNYYIDFISDQGLHYTVVTGVERNKETGKRVHFMRFDEFFTGKSSSRLVFDERYPPIFQPLGRQEGVVVTLGLEGTATVVKPNETLSDVERYGQLKSKLAVTETIAVDDGYIVDGKSEDGYPLIVKLDKKLNTVRELRVPSKGQVNSLFPKNDKIYAILDYEQKPSEMLELSSGLSIITTYKLSTGLVTGIPLHDGGFAITYTAVPSMDVFIEKLNANAKPLWKKRVFTRKGINSMLYTVVELPGGLAIVGSRDNQLIVARVDIDGQRVQIAEDMDSGLRAPTAPVGYLVGVRGREIHIRGMVNNEVASQTAFYFIDTP